MRTVSMPMIGALTSGVKNANAPMTTSARRATASSSESRKSGSGIATIATAASFSSGTFCASLLRDDRAERARRRRSAEEEAEHVRVGVVAEVREPCTPTMSPCATKLIAQAAIMIGPSKRVAHQEPHAGEHALLLRGRLDAPARRARRARS